MERTESVLKYASFIVEDSNRTGDTEVEVLMIYDYEEDKYKVSVTAIDTENPKINCLMREEWFENDQITQAEMYYCFECQKLMYKWRSPL